MDSPALRQAARRSDPLLYEVNTRCWVSELSHKYGSRITLANVPEAELAALAELGFTHIWLMGVWSTGPKARGKALLSSELRGSLNVAVPGWTPDDLGASPYAVADYTVPQHLGGNEGLAIFREQLHRRGQKLLLDFVPNHLGLDHPWVLDRPSLFVQGHGPGHYVFPVRLASSSQAWLAHGRDPNFPPWTDTVQLDYRVISVHETMSNLLLKLAALCDGVRCDMAMLLLRDVFEKTWGDFPVFGTRAQEEFWAMAIRRVRERHPHFIMMAEVYWGREDQLQDLGFDYVYDKELLDHLVARDYAAVYRHLNNTPFERLRRRVHFLENHDEQRAAVLFSGAEHRAVSALLLILPGMTLLYQGQLEGACRKVPVQLERSLPEAIQPEVFRWYEHLLKAVKESAVGHGHFELLNVRSCAAGADISIRQPVIGIAWRSGAGTDIVLVNLSSAEVESRAALKELEGGPQWQTSNLLQDFGEQMLRPELENGGLSVVLQPHECLFMRLQVPGRTPR